MTNTTGCRVDVLWPQGWESDLAQTDGQAIGLLADQSYDVLLLDMDLPIDDGWQVLTWLKDHNVNTPIVA